MIRLLEFIGLFVPGTGCCPQNSSHEIRMEIGIPLKDDPTVSDNVMTEREGGVIDDANICGIFYSIFKLNFQIKLIVE